MNIFEKVDAVIKSIDELEAKTNKEKSKLGSFKAEYYKALFEEWKKSYKFSPLMSELVSISVHGEHQFNDGDTTYLSWHFDFEFDGPESDKNEIHTVNVSSYGDMDFDSEYEFSDKEMSYIEDITASIGKVIEADPPNYLSFAFHFNRDFVELDHI